MSEEQQPTAAKKPPAHEVILARLAKLQDKMNKVGDPFLEPICGELLGILARMHLPEKERPKILAAVRAFDPWVIGKHHARARLIKRLRNNTPSAE